MGYYRDGKFYVSHYFLGEMGEEERMIAELSQFFKDMEFQSVVTYNGKAFDMPLLETRFILHKQDFPLSDLPHLDFLFAARSLWRHKVVSCRLYNLALEVLRTGRSEDIPSAEIPWRYFQYLQTGNYELIEPIIYHNQEDILSLLGVLVIGSQIFAEDHEACVADAMDFYGAGRVLENIGEVERSMRFFERALDGNLEDSVSLQAKKRLSMYFKKAEDWGKALSLWQQMASSQSVSKEQLFSIRELAMYLEHREKKYEEARKIAEEGYVLSIEMSEFYQKDFAQRLQRLKNKIKNEHSKVK
jgi:tetratricopeptide (TPR) repeat protein